MSKRKNEIRFYIKGGLLKGVDKLNHKYLKEILNSIVLQIVLKTIEPEVKSLKNDFMQRSDFLEILNDRDDINISVNDTDLEINVFSEQNDNTSENLHDIIDKVFQGEIDSNILLSNQILDSILLLFWEIKFTNKNNTKKRLIRTFWSREEIRQLVESDFRDNEQFATKNYYDRQFTHSRQKARSLRQSLVKLITLLEKLKEPKEPIKLLTKLLDLVEEALNTKIRNGI